MTREIKRAYRILGLRAGAPQAEIKAAYRDLAQVWHPDRFSHSDRLQEKAQRNLKRINEAFQVLKDYTPAPGEAQESALSSTMSAVLDLGDLLQTQAIQREKVRYRQQQSAQPARPAQPGPSGRPGGGNRARVVGLEDWERTGVIRKKRVRRRKPALWIGVVVLVLIVAALVLLTPQIRSFFFGP
jgi:curved DNA-binding protein CbpA